MSEGMKNTTISLDYVLTKLSLTAVSMITAQM